MGMLVAAGLDANTLMGGTFFSDPAADPLFPFSNVAIGRPGIFGRFGSLTADPYVTCDRDLLRNTGSGEIFTAGVPGSPTTRQWVEAVTGTGSVIQEGTIKHNGNFSIACLAGTGIATAHVDIPVRAGDSYLLDLFLRTTSGGAAIVRVRNLHTGRFLNPAAPGDWVDTIFDVINYTGTTFAERSAIFNVEDVETCQRPVVTLRIQIAEEVATKNSYFDDLYLIPQATHLYVVGHNITPRSGLLELRGSEDNFAADDQLIEDDILPLQPAFYKDLRPAVGLVAYRYVRLQFVETNVGEGQIYLGEWGLAYFHELQQPPGYPIVKNLNDPQVRGELPYGGEYSVGVGPQYRPQAGVELAFRQGDAASQEFLEEIYLRTSGGQPLAIIPDDTKPDIYFGKIAPQLSTRREGFATHDTTLVLRPSPLPLLIP